MPRGTRLKKYRADDINRINDLKAGQLLKFAGDDDDAYAIFIKMKQVKYSIKPKSRGETRYVVEFIIGKEIYTLDAAEFWDLCEVL